MNQHIVSLLKHIFERKDKIFNNLAIICWDVINQLLTTGMIYWVRHLICVNPILTKFLSFFKKLWRNIFWFDLFKYNFIFNNFFVFEENTLNLMKRMLINLKLLRNSRFLLNLVYIFLYIQFMRPFAFLLIFLFLNFRL